MITGLFLRVEVQTEVVYFRQDASVKVVQMVTCDQALFSFRSVKHSGGTVVVVVGRVGMISGYRDGGCMNIAAAMYAVDW